MGYILGHIKGKLAHVIGLLSAAKESRDEEEVAMLVSEALSISHDTFAMIDAHEQAEAEEEEEEEEEDLEDAIETVEAAGGDVEVPEAVEVEGERLENPRGRTGWTDKDERKYQAIKQSAIDYGSDLPEAQRIAAATVNRDRNVRRRRRSRSR